MGWINPFDVVIILLYILAVLTVLGNIMVVVAILSQEKTRKVRSNRFLISLAVADMCVGLFVMIPSVAKAQAGFWSWGAALCKLWVTLDVCFCSASIYSLIGISIDRFYAVYRPLSYATQTSNLFTNVLIVLAWVVACVISFPMYVNVKSFSNWRRVVERHTETCAPPTDPASAGYVIYAGTMAFIVPAVVLTSLYVAVGHHMRARQRARIGRAQKVVKMESKVKVWREERSHSCSGHHIRVELAPEQLSHNPDSGFLEHTNPEALTPVPVRKVWSGPPRLGANLQELEVVRQGLESQGSWVEGEGFETSDHQGLEGLQEFEIKQLMSIIRNGSRRTKNLTRAERKLRAEERIQTRITVMMGVIIGTFALCWMPFATMFFLSPYSSVFRDFMESHPAVIEVLTWIGYCNSVINPILYASMNKEIKTGMIRVLCPLHQETLN